MTGNRAGLGVAKEEFLAQVRNALGKRAAESPSRPYPRLEEDADQLGQQALEVWRRIEENRAGLLDRLADTAALRGWNVHRVGNGEEAVGRIVAIVTEAGVRRVARSAQEVFEDVPVHRALAEAGVNVATAAKGESRGREEVREEIIAAGLGITGADYAVAETGSVVVVPRAGLSRLVSLVPPVHVAVVRPGDVVESLDDVFLLRRLEYHRNGGDMGSYLNFITGPSRTADIEQTLVVGVHGPREVHMVLLG